MANEGLAVLLMMIFAAVLSIGERNEESFSADLMTCSQSSKDGKKCLFAEANGVYKATLLKGAAACAVGFNDHTGTRFSKGSLTYLDQDNWQCVGTVPIDVFSVTASMQNGDFNITANSSENGMPLFDLNAEPNFGFWGKLKHWARSPFGMSCGIPLMSMKVCKPNA